MEDLALNLSVNDIIQELNDKNLIHMTSGKIKEMKNNILQKLYLERSELLKYHKVLKDYKFVDELDEIKLGSYIRWFNLNKMEHLQLTNGGIIVDFKKGNDDILIVCKNRMQRIFTLKMNQCVIFQKLSSQERVLIKIIDYINK